MEGLIGFWVVCGIAGAVIASKPGRGVTGFFLGLLLGPVGVIVACSLKSVAASPSAAKAAAKFACRSCGATIVPGPADIGEAIVCPRCRELVPIPGRRKRDRQPALAECPDCGRDVSTRAAACPHCGCPAEA